MKFKLPALLALTLLAACNRNNESDEPVCRLSDNPNYYYYGSMPVQLPNAFTPNGDGKNDLLRPVMAMSLSAFSMTVFDKDGTTLFYTADTASAGWDGRNNSGQKMAPGRYRVTITYRSSYGGNGTYQYCVALLNYGTSSCIPQSGDGNYYFEDMWNPSYQSFSYSTAERLCQ